MTSRGLTNRSLVFTLSRPEQTVRPSARRGPRRQRAQAALKEEPMRLKAGMISALFFVSFPLLASSLAITTSSLPGATVGTAYGETLAATGGRSPYTWSLASGSLPPGLSLSTSKGVIWGTPTASGTYSLVVRVKDSATYPATAIHAESIAI